MNVSLTPKAQRVVRQRVNSGEYDSAQHYLQQLVLRDEQRRRRRKTEAMLVKRMDRTQSVEMDDADFAAIGRRIARMVGRRKSA
jgi:Arc/MetJ-type ribon-helix-helix transcriptional regulator